MGSPDEDDNQSSPDAGDSRSDRQWKVVVTFSRSGGPASTGRGRRRSARLAVAVLIVVTVTLTSVLITHPQLGLRLIACATSVFVSRLGLR
jgi:hypothetical protein